MELIQDDDIDLVYIAVPHNEHYRIAKLCIENKKNVLCENLYCKCRRNKGFISFS